MENSMHSFEHILALDTSVANQVILNLITKKEFLQNTYKTTNLESELIPMIDHFLSDADLTIEKIDLFMLGKGPGSFMGLRIGFSVIKSWAWLFDKPITLISSLKLLTDSYFFSEENVLIIPCIDSKMNRVFANITYNNKIILDDCDIFPEQLAEYIIKYKKNIPSEKIVILGSGTKLLEPYLLSEKNIIYQPDYSIQNNVFKKYNIQEISNKAFFQKSKDLLSAIAPNYIRKSAAEMSLKNLK